MRLRLTTRPQPDASGAVPLYVRIAHRDVNRFVSLGLNIHPTHWNARTREVRKTHPDSVNLQRILSQRLQSAENAAADELGKRGRFATADHLKAAVATVLNPIETTPEDVDELATPLNVVDYGRGLAAGKIAAGKIGTSRVYKTALRHFGDTLNGLRLDGLPFDGVTPALLRAHEERLQGLGQKRNYIAKQLATLRIVFRRAAADDVPGGASAVAAMAKVPIRTERAAKPRLDRDDVRKMEALVGVVENRRADVLDWWIWAFYTGGMRFGDVAALRWSSIEHDDDGRAIYARWRMRKTGDAQGVPILPAAADVLDRWRPRTGGEPFVFGMFTEAELKDPETAFNRISSFNAIARKELRKIAEQAGVPYVGFHGARHSLADILRKMGVPVHTISQVLGHGHLSTTVSYLSGFDRGSVEDALRGLA